MDSQIRNDINVMLKQTEIPGYCRSIEFFQVRRWPQFPAFCELRLCKQKYDLRKNQVALFRLVQQLTCLQ